MLSLRNLSVAVLALALAVCFTASRVTAEDAKGSVSGKITKPDGSAADGARVALMNPMAKGEKHKPAAAADKPKGEKPTPVKETTADKDGKYTLSDVAPGKYVVQANLKGSGRGHEQVEVKAGETATVDLKLEPPKAK